MGKKKKSPPAEATHPTSIRIPGPIYRQLVERSESSGKSVSAVILQMVEASLDGPQRVEEEELVRVLQHFEDRLMRKIVDLNFNLRQATGMILTPKPKPSRKPDARHAIETSKDAANWIESKFREIP